MLTTVDEERTRIEKFKDGWKPNSCTPRGLFQHCLTAQEQCDVGEGVATAILSLYPRYLQSISRAANGCPYDLTANMVSLNKIIGIQVKTTGTEKIRLTSNNNNPVTRVAHRPDYSVQHAIFVVHADYQFYFIPTKEIFSDPTIKEKFDDPAKPQVFAELGNYEKFKVHFDYMFIGPLPEILKYEDYWI
jgi:hypothetical protein